MSHGLSAQRVRRTKSRGPKGLQLEVVARRASRLLVVYNHHHDRHLDSEVLLQLALCVCEHLESLLSLGEFGVKSPKVILQLGNLLDESHMRHVSGCFCIWPMRPKLEPGLGNLERRLLGPDGVLDVVDVLAQVVHLLQVEGEVGLQLAVNLAALCNPEDRLEIPQRSSNDLVVKAWLVAFQDSSIAFAALARWCST